MKYIIIECSNGNLNTVREVCKDSDSLRFLGEVTGVNFEIQGLDLPIRLINKSKE